MIDAKTTENPWAVPVRVDLWTNVTLSGFDLVKTQEPTLIMGPVRMGMSLLMRLNTKNGRNP